MTSPRARKPVVYITGETDLITEFGGVCAASGLSVVCPPAARGSGPPLPATFRKSSTVPAGSIAAVELTNIDLDLKRKNLARIDRSLADGIPIVSSSVTVTAGTQAAWVRRPGRLVGFAGFPTLMGGPLAEIAIGPRTADPVVPKVRDFFGKVGKEISVVQDRVGLVMPRILCALINEACFALTEEVSSPGDIDTAMKLGTNYPRGPLEWAALAGVGQVIAVLDALRGDTGEERYRVAPLLRQMASSPALWK
jgi:3-hydroxybutyryl-CoA dehydrogenase